MATGVASWSQTAASNATADANVNWAEGQDPGSVNDSARAEMASVAMFRDDISGALTTGGSSTAYTLTSNQGFASLSAMNGMMLVVRFDQANGASPTLAVDGLTAEPIQTASGTAVSSGMIAANSIWALTYDNSIPAFIMHGVRIIVAADIPSSTISYAKIQNVTDVRLLGNATGGAAAPSEISVTTPLALGSSALTIGAASDSAAGVQENAVQSEMETGTSTTLTVVPGRQHYHASACKTWCENGVSGNISASYNVTSVSDTATGRATVNIATDFSSSLYSVVAMTEATSGDAFCTLRSASRTAGVYEIDSWTETNGILGAVDPIAYNSSAFGDHA